MGSHGPPSLPTPTVLIRGRRKSYREKKKEDRKAREKEEKEKEGDEDLKCKCFPSTLFCTSFYVCNHFPPLSSKLVFL